MSDILSSILVLFGLGVLAYQAGKVYANIEYLMDEVENLGKQNKRLRKEQIRLFEILESTTPEGYKE